MNKLFDIKVYTEMAIANPSVTSLTILVTQFLEKKKLASGVAQAERHRLAN